MGEAPNTKDKNLRLSEGKKTYKWKQDKENPLQYIQWGEKMKEKDKRVLIGFYVSTRWCWINFHIGVIYKLANLHDFNHYWTQIEVIPGDPTKLKWSIPYDVREVTEYKIEDRYA